MRRGLIFSVILIAAPMSRSQQLASPLPNSQPQIKLRLTETVSSSNAKVGQPILFEAVDPVEVNGKLIVAAGAHSHALVTAARHRGHNRREGKLLLTIQTVSLTDGSEAVLQSAILQEGSGRGMPIFGPCTFPIPVDPAGLFRKGNDVVIPKGTELVATIVLHTP